MVVGLVWFQ